MMTEEMAKKLKRSVVLHEQKLKFPYLDTKNKITIGIGYNLSDRGLPDEWIDSQYQEDVNYFYETLNFTFEFFKELNEDRQIALIDMCYNLGFKQFCKFSCMLDALQKHDYEKASYEMLNSDWANQVKGRAQTLANAVRDGVYSI